MRGYSLHIGLDFVDEEHYNTPMGLNCGVTDAELLARFAEGTRNFHKPRLLINDKATTENIFLELDSFAQLSQDNPQEEFYFYITATCHGFQLGTKYGGEDGRLELLCLYDRMILEHEIRERLARIGNNSKVLLVVGSCYAGGLFNEETELGLSEEQSVINKNREFYTDLIKNYHQMKFEFEAGVFFLGAVEKDISAVVGGTSKPSPFIEVFHYVSSHIDFHANYFELVDLIKVLSHVDRIPYALQRGNNLNFFANYKPIFFKVKISEINLKTINMNWNITLRYDQNTRPMLHADVEYPNTYEYVNTIYTKDPNDVSPTLLYDEALDDYKEGDYLRIVQFRSIVESEESEVSIDLRVYKKREGQLPHTVHVVAVDTTTKKSKVKKSKKEVNDEIGGTDNLD
jgi:hypothetical protein